MAIFRGGSHLFGIFITLTSLGKFSMQESIDLETTTICTSTEKNTYFHSLSTNETDSEGESFSEGMKKSSNISHLKGDWDEASPKLKFPKVHPEERFRMKNLHLERGLNIFEFLRRFLSFIQPYDIPVDLVTDAIDNRIDWNKVFSQTIRLEAGFIAVMAVCGILMFVLPGTELWLACRPLRPDYRPSRHPGFLTFFLTISAFIMGSSMVTILICNIEFGSGTQNIPTIAEIALQDLKNYHSGMTNARRVIITRSLDISAEAILMDLDGVEDLLGRPVQESLASETGLDVALEALLDIANASQELSNKVDWLLKSTERARDEGVELNREAESLRRELETATKACPFEDRALCATLNPSGLHFALRLERIIRDERLMNLRRAGRENLTEASRQVRGEYYYIPQHISKRTLDARNQIRREINVVRSRIFEETRNLESSSSELSKHLDSVRGVINKVMPYVNAFENIRWFVGIGTVLCIFFIWLLLICALCCRCGSSEGGVRPTLLWTVFFTCVISIALWAVIVCALALSTHIELLLCRPLHDPEYRTVEAVIATKRFLGKRLSVSLKDLMEKCQQNETAYPAFQLDSSIKLEELTSHWTWTGLSRTFNNFKINLSGLQILSPILQQRLQNLLFSSGANLTEHRILIQGPIMEQDLSALSDQIDNVARQMRDRRNARDLLGISASMRDLSSRKVKPLMKMQDELVYQLAVLELQMQPLQRQVNQSLSHLKTIQYYIDNQGETIAQMRTKYFKDRLSGYLDQWRKYVITEMGSEVSKCRPLWDILQGIKFLICQHILGPLNGFWFAAFICVVLWIFSTPTAHCLASIYRKDQGIKDLVLLHSRNDSPETVVMDRDNWRIPEPPPSRDSW